MRAQAQLPASPYTVDLISHQERVLEAVRAREREAERRYRQELTVREELRVLVVSRALREAQQQQQHTVKVAEHTLEKRCKALQALEKAAALSAKALADPYRRGLLSPTLPPEVLNLREGAWEHRRAERQKELLARIARVEAVRDAVDLARIVKAVGRYQRMGLSSAGTLSGGTL